MRIFLWIVGGLAVAIAAAVAWWVINYPTYTYRYRLTIAFEIDGVVHTGSSVIEVAHKGGPEFGGAGSYAPKLYGQAVYIDLGRRGAIVAALTLGTFEGDVVKGPRNMVWIGASAFGNQSTKPELPELPRLRGRRALAADNLPDFIWFSNPADPATARRFLLHDIPALFGPNARLADAFVEITGEPVVLDIDKKLPWFEPLAREQKARGVITRYGEFKLIHNMFIGDGS
jgi:hypothetical protein